MLCTMNKNNVSHNTLKGQRFKRVNGDFLQGQQNPCSEVINHQDCHTLVQS